jgi:dihydrofolate reductase
MTHLHFHAVAAMAKNRVIGLDGKMPWHFPEDLKFFKQLTQGHPIIMGRKTWDSLGRPLPGRRNIVLSRSSSELPGAEVVSSVEALGKLDGLVGDAYVIGGAEIYRLLLPHTASIYLTELEIEPAGDTFFPEFEAGFPKKTLLAENGVCRWYHYEKH